MSNKVSDILHSKSETIVTNVNNKTKTIVNCKGYKCTVQQVDLLVDDAARAGVTNPKMRAWYCQAAYKLGSDLFMRCVSNAREGRDPVKLFSYLLNVELKKVAHEVAKDPTNMTQGTYRSATNPV